MSSNPSSGNASLSGPSNNCGVSGTAADWSSLSNLDNLFSPSQVSINILSFLMKRFIKINRN